jgi:hypothetical protein
MPLLIDIVNKRPAARAERGSSAPAAEDCAGTRWTHGVLQAVPHPAFTQ